MKKTKFVPGKRKNWNSLLQQQQPTTCTRELLAGELAQCSQCSLIWDENVHVVMELIEHKYEFSYNFCS
jgi:hypothetical protein